MRGPTLVVFYDPGSEIFGASYICLVGVIDTLEQINVNQLGTLTRRHFDSKGPPSLSRATAGSLRHRLRMAQNQSPNFPGWLASRSRRRRLVEAGRVELPSKTVGHSITTSVSPVLFLDTSLCRGHIGVCPVRFI